MDRRGFIGSFVAAVCALFPREILSADKSILTDAEMASHIACHCTKVSIDHMGINSQKIVTIENPGLNGPVVHIPDVLFPSIITPNGTYVSSFTMKGHTIDLANDVSIRSVCCEYPDSEGNAFCNAERYFCRVEGGWKECLPNER